MIFSLLLYILKTTQYIKMHYDLCHKFTYSFQCNYAIRIIRYNAMVRLWSAWWVILFYFICLHQVLYNEFFKPLLGFSNHLSFQNSQHCKEWSTSSSFPINKKKQWWRQLTNNSNTRTEQQRNNLNQPCEKKIIKISQQIKIWNRLLCLEHYFQDNIWHFIVRTTTYSASKGLMPLGDVF